MLVRRLLVLVPVIITLFLLQSYFWVPTFEQQARTTNARLSQYITASIGDAQILNPILASDVPSGMVTGVVFEGLIDRDKDLNFRARLAESWEITEEAYFIVNPDDPRTPDEIVTLVRDAQAKGVSDDTELGKALRNIRALEILPADTCTVDMPLDAPPSEESPEGKPLGTFSFIAERPPRVKLTLQSVDQDLFKSLALMLGESYFKLDTTKYLRIGEGRKRADKSATEAEIARVFGLKKAELAKKIVPAAEHNPIITFHLRKGVKFHDGHEFDSGDVAFTYQQIMNPRNLSPRLPDYEPVKSVEPVDRYTVRIVYKELYSPAFASWGMGMLPEHLLNAEALADEAKRRGIEPADMTVRKSEFNLRPIGCGPFKFSEWRTDQYIKMTRFDDYWEGPPEYKEYLVRIMPDLVSQELEFQAGAVDGYTPLPHQVARMKQDSRFQNFTGLAYSYDYIGYNMRREIFKDSRVRRALGMALDLDRIIKYVYYDEAERMTGPFAKQTIHYNHEVKPLDYDPAAALKLFEDAGWKRGSDGWLRNAKGEKFQFTLMTNNGNDLRRDIMAIAQDSWRKIGVDVRTETVEWSVFISRHVDRGDFDAVVLGWGMGVEPDLYQIWHSSQSQPYMLNFVAYNNPVADDLIIRIRQEYNDAKQVELCHKLHEVIAQDQPYTFISVSKVTALLDKRIFIVRRDKGGKIIGYERIKATKTGNYTYDFNKWIKLPQVPAEVIE